MAVTEQCRKEIIESGGTRLLVSFLSARAPSYSGKESPQSSDSGDVQQAALLSCEKVLQKAAIALARLARDQTSAEHILDLEGTSCIWVFDINLLEYSCTAL